MELKFLLHPVAKEPTPGAEFEAFCDDLKIRGQILPMLAVKGEHNGDVLVFDGARRLRACEKLRVEPKYLLVDGTNGSPAELAASLNLLRKHYSPSQRA